MATKLNLHVVLQLDVFLLLFFFFLCPCTSTSSLALFALEACDIPHNLSRGGTLTQLSGVVLDEFTHVRLAMVAIGQAPLCLWAPDLTYTGHSCYGRFLQRVCRVRRQTLEGPAACATGFLSPPADGTRLRASTAGAASAAPASLSHAPPSAQSPVWPDQSVGTSAAVVVPLPKRHWNLQLVWRLGKQGDRTTVTPFLRLCTSPGRKHDGLRCGCVPDVTTCHMFSKR